MQKVMARIPEVERSDFWRQANSDGVAMYAHVMTDDGLFVEATNVTAARWWRGIDQLLCHDQFKHRMLSNLLMLAYVGVCVFFLCMRSIDRSIDQRVG